MRLLLAARSDSEDAIAAARTHYGDLLEAGARIFETREVVMHAKTVVIDGVWSAIGSSNSTCHHWPTPGSYSPETQAVWESPSSAAQGWAACDRPRSANGLLPALDAVTDEAPTSRASLSLPMGSTG